MTRYKKDRHIRRLLVFSCIASFALILTAFILSVTPEARVGAYDSTKNPALAGISYTGENKDCKEYSDDWRLILVNSTHSLDMDYSVELMTLSCGEKIDKRIYDSLQQMFDDMRSEGINPVVNSGYRSRTQQQKLFDDKVREYSGIGTSEYEAITQALAYVAAPGTSEHETGLAVDIGASKGSTAEEVQQWLMYNSYRYGFILRYPAIKTDVTGIRYEPWHYRYVGKEAASEIYRSGLCLEEYLCQLS